MDFQRFNQQQNQAYAGAQTQTAEYDEGLRAYMLKVYNYMAAALAFTGAIAFFGSTSEALISTIYNAQGGMTGIGWVIALAPLGFVFFLSAKVHSMQLQTAQICFWAFSALMGLSLTSIFLLYTGESIARVFFITAGVFGAMSLYGYTTKKDLTSMGSFLIMGLFGIIIASLVNLFLQSAAMQFIISFIGVFIFIGLTAYDTQRVKNTYHMLGGNAEVVSKAAIMGALSLYLDFINLFIMLLRFFGERR